MKKTISALASAAVWFALIGNASAAAPVFDLQLSADVASAGSVTGPEFPNPGFVESVTVPAGTVSNVNIYGNTRFLGANGVRGSASGAVTSNSTMRWRASGCPPEATCSFFSAHGDDPMTYPWSSQNMNYPLTYPSAPYLDVQINPATPSGRYDLAFTVEEDPARCAAFDSGCMTPVTKTFTIQVAPSAAVPETDAPTAPENFGASGTERLTGMQTVAAVVIIFVTAAGLAFYLRRRMLGRRVTQDTNANR